MKESIILKKGKQQSILRHHPWIFSGAIRFVPEGIAEGDLVSVKDADGNIMGVGYYQIGSISVRLLEFGVDSLPDNFFYTRLSNAFSLRSRLGLINENNNCCRIVHGEGDFLPGLIVDLYGDTAVIQAHSPGMHYCRKEIASALIQIPGSCIRNVYYKSETTLPYKAFLEPQNEYLVGHYDGSVAMENGFNFNIDWLKGQKTGFFIDQRDNRNLLRRYSHGQKVLNLFCYTGGFSVYALGGGAVCVDSVDSSSKAIELTDANVRMNFGDNARHRSFALDAFKFLSDVPQDYYSLMILDPPAFVKHRAALKNGLTGYRRLNAKAMEKICKGGIIFTFSCSQLVSKDMFRMAVFSAAEQAGRKVRILHQLSQGADHPVNIAHPEGEYLKGLVLYIE